MVVNEERGSEREIKRETKKERMSSSGSLPFATYHRASHLGAGSYGSVVCAYSAEGDEVALKIFSNDDDNDEDNDDDECEGSSSSRSSSFRPSSSSPMDLGVLREISCLRLFRGDNSHPNITTLIDVQPHWRDENDEDEPSGGGAGCGGGDRLCMALPLYHGRSLKYALEQRGGYAMDRRAKVEIAHGLLSALAFLHDNRWLHRDIKPDNIMLETSNDDCENTTQNGLQRWTPILIDFSLAKQQQSLEGDLETEEEFVEHTGGAGTVTYMAPEVCRHEPYGSPADVWSVGVVLLELLVGSLMPAQKDKHAWTWIESTLDSLPTDQPFPDLIRHLLEPAPRQRWTARQALAHPLFVLKFQLPVPPKRIVDISTALPLDVAEEATDDGRTAAASKKNRRERVARLCRHLNAKNPQTPLAALEYAMALSQLDDTIDHVDSCLLLHCVVLAFRFLEVEALDLRELEEQDRGPFANWTLEDYVDEEATIFMMLDFCLYPRGVALQESAGSSSSRGAKKK